MNTAPRHTSLFSSAIVLGVILLSAMAVIPSRGDAALDGVTMAPWSGGAQGPAATMAARIRAVFGERSEAALCVADVESRMDPYAIYVNDDGSRDRGLFQVNSLWHAGLSDRDAFNPTLNIAYAYELSDGGRNWQWWSAVTRERCGLG